MLTLVRVVAVAPVCTRYTRVVARIAFGFRLRIFNAGEADRVDFKEGKLPTAVRPAPSGMISSYQEPIMGAAVKKTISLPAELARDAEALAKAQGKTLSAVIQDALRDARIDRRLQELRGVQGYWSRKARERGLLSERDLERYLNE
jgi:predicted transcriptional regulator